MKFKFLILIFIILSKGISSFAQSKIIPIIKYEPDNLVATVRKSLSCPEFNFYIKIGNDESYFFKLDKEAARMNNTDHYPILQKSKLFENDSIFAFYFMHYPARRFNGKLPIEYWGKLSNGDLTFFTNTSDYKEYSLNELINKEFGNIDNFKILFMNNVLENLDTNIDNGIYPRDKKSAVIFFQNDFEFYSDCFPEKVQISDSLLLYFIESSISCTPKTKEQLGKLPEIRDDLKIFLSDKSLKQEEPSYALLSTFDNEQITELIRKNKIRKYLKRYYFYLLRTMYVPLPEEDDVKILNEEEQFLQLKEDVFSLSSVE